MTISEKKLKLIERITSSEDQIIIDEMMKMIDLEIEETPYVFSRSRKRKLPRQEDNTIKEKFIHTRSQNRKVRNG